MRLPRKRALPRSPFSRVVQRVRSIFRVFVASKKKKKEKKATLTVRMQAATDRYDSPRATPFPSPDNIDGIAIKVYPRYEKLRATSGEASSFVISDEIAFREIKAGFTDTSHSGRSRARPVSIYPKHAFRVSPFSPKHLKK